MSHLQITAAEIEGVTNRSDKIHVEEFKTHDFAVFVVHYDRRQWKRLRPNRGGQAPFWVERNADGLYGPVSGQTEAWLDSIWKRADEFPKIVRFPRRDEDGERLIMNLGQAHDSGDTDSMLLHLKEIYDRIVVSPHQSRVLPVGLTWDTLPRFDPSLAKKTRWLIKQFLAEGSIQLVYGERGSFKSTLFLCAAKAIASGEEFLGMETRRRRVLYLDFENPSNIIKARNDDLGLRLPVNPNLVIWDRFGNHPLPKPGDPALEAFVRQCIAETGKGPWIIFDSWSSLLRPGEGGENTGQIAPIYAHLRKLADLGATITVLDHTRKYMPDVIYGGQDKEAKVDSILNLITFDNALRPQNAVVRGESWLKRYAPKGIGVFAFEVQSKKDKNDEWHVSGLMSVKDPVEEEKRRKREVLRDLIRLNPELGQEALGKLAAKKGVKGFGRDEAIELLKAGTGKYWKVKKMAHGKFIYKLP